MPRPKHAAAIREALAELNPDALTADGLEAALVGHTLDRFRPALAVYSVDACVATVARRHRSSEAEALEFLEFNTFGAWAGPGTPLFVRLFG
jgi:hypothetical protein